MNYYGGLLQPHDSTTYYIVKYIFADMSYWINSVQFTFSLQPKFLVFFQKYIKTDEVWGLIAYSDYYRVTKSEEIKFSVVKSFAFATSPKIFMQVPQRRLLFWR